MIRRSPPDQPGSLSTKWLTGTIPDSLDLMSCSEKLADVIQRRTPKGADPVYQEHFEAFLQHTNEKSVIGEKLKAIAGKVRDLVGSDIIGVDLGAGDGRLLRRVAPAFSRVLAVE